MNYTNFWGIDFYPTPPEVIEQMLTDADVYGKFILEPSAGSGNIVDALNQRGAKVSACEIDARLRKVLSGKCSIIAEDFMQVTSEQVSHIDFIIMNPPFSKAEEHILHAYEIAPEGCEIISLCNSEMLCRTYSQTRKRITELINNYGLSDDLGSCFSHAERPTDVKVSCIHLWKPRTGAAEFDGYFGYDDAEEQGGNTAGLMQYNVIRDIVNRYVEAVRRFDSVESSSREINELTSLFTTSEIRFGAYRPGKNIYHEITRQEYKNELQKAAWRVIFDKMDMDKYVTRGVREDINRYIERQQNVPFTMRNIFKMLDLIVHTHGNRMEKTLVEAFDKICSFSAENSTAGEKWKTNSDYMINRRFIVPYITDYDTRYPSDYVSFSYWSSGRCQDIDDIIRALCYITGTPYERTVTLRETRERKIDWGVWHTMSKVLSHADGTTEVVTGFFRIRGYKKGTMHFEFLDDDVWAKFNQAVAKIKGWQLPKQRNSRK